MSVRSVAALAETSSDSSALHSLAADDARDDGVDLHVFVVAHFFLGRVTVGTAKEKLLLHFSLVGQ